MRCWLPVPVRCPPGGVGESASFSVVCLAWNLSRMKVSESGPCESGRAWWFVVEACDKFKMLGLLNMSELARTVPWSPGDVPRVLF